MVRKATYTLTALLMMFALTMVNGVSPAHATDHMSKEEAGKIVTDKYGGTVKNVEEESDGAIYEVEVEDSDEGRIEVDVDAAKGNGDILKVEYEDNDKEDESNIISKEKAEEVATDKYGGHVKETEIEHEEDNDGNYVLVYEVELRGTGEGETEVDVVASNGEIFDKESDNDDDKGDHDKDQISKQKALDIVIEEYGGKPDGDLDDAVGEEDDGDTWEVEVIDSSKGNIEVDVDAYSGDIDKDSIEKDNISKEEAGKIATDKYGGDIKEIQKEHEDGVLVYEVEIRNSDEGRIEVDVAAGSGDIVDMEKEDEDEPISKKEAGKIVTDKYGGDVINVEKEHENGKLVYEVEVKNSKQGRIEVDVDAATGKILNVEKEDNDENNQDQTATGNNQNNGNGGPGMDNQEGGLLAKTSSDYPLGALAGLLLVVSGGALFLFRKKAHSKKSNPSNP